MRAIAIEKPRRLGSTRYLANGCENVRPLGSSAPARPERHIGESENWFERTAIAQNYRLDAGPFSSEHRHKLLGGKKGQ